MTGRALPAGLPGCGRAASVRVEVYSPRDGRAHGSLDGSRYVCAEHLDPVCAALSAAGLTPFTVPGTATGSKRCGDGADFTGERVEFLTAPAPADEASVTATGVAHYQSAGWGGAPAECGVECACGVTFDHFDTIAEAAALLDDHIARAGKPSTAPADLAPVSKPCAEGRCEDCWPLRSTHGRAPVCTCTCHIIPAEGGPEYRVVVRDEPEDSYVDVTRDGAVVVCWTFDEACQVAQQLADLFGTFTGPASARSGGAS